MREGAIGLALHEGESVLTVTGRQTSPFPRIDLKTERRTTATLKRVDTWLVTNALAEAEARRHPAYALPRTADNLTPADRDTAEAFLFCKESI